MMAGTKELCLELFSSFLPAFLGYMIFIPCLFYDDDIHGVLLFLTPLETPIFIIRFWLLGLWIHIGSSLMMIYPFIRFRKARLAPPYTIDGLQQSQDVF